MAFSLGYAVLDWSDNAMKERRLQREQLEVELEIAPTMELEEAKDDGND